MPSRLSNRAFSLIELVIVVVIIGIIGAIAIPRTSRGAEGASESALRSDLRTMRNSIELYRAEHNGDYPAAKGDGVNAAGTPRSFKNQLLKLSDVNGVTSETPDPSFPFGPYLREIPPGPLGPATGDTRVNVKTAGTPLSGNATPSRAWKYDAVTGQLIFTFNGTSSNGTSFEDW